MKQLIFILWQFLVCAGVMHTVALSGNAAAPIANAGPDSAINENDEDVMLNGLYSSDPEDGALVYTWTQIAGTPVTLSSSSEATPTFTAPSVGVDGDTLTFQLIVTDDEDLTDSDTVEILVYDINVPPTAVATDQSVYETATGVLNASGSTDADGSIAAYAWVQTAGTTVTLSNASAPQPTFTPPDVGFNGEALTFVLTVTDNGGLQASDTCTVNVLFINSIPIADAGIDQTVNESTLVTLNGVGSSDPDADDMIRFQWSRLSGAPVTLYAANAVEAMFMAPNVELTDSGGAVNLVFQLVVTDRSGLQSVADTCTVTVSFVNQAPIADAGVTQTVTEGSTVTLNGLNSSDPDENDTLTYAWSQMPGTNVTLSSSTSAQPQFTAPVTDADGEALTFSLTVTDQGGGTSTDTCIVNISDLNNPPSASAGTDQTVVNGTDGEGGVVVTLDGSASADADLNDSIAAFLWEQVAGVSVTLIGATTAQSAFVTPDVAIQGEALIFKLTVTDEGGLKDAETVVVNVTHGNAPPSADAGEDQQVREGTTVTLNGSGTADADGDIVYYLWQQTSGVSTVLSDTMAVAPTFVTPAVDEDASLVFTLSVKDNTGLIGTDSVTITVSDNGVTLYPENVISFGTATEMENYVGIDISSGGDLIELYPLDAAIIQDLTGRPTEIPYGMVSTKIKVDHYGDTISMIVYLPTALPATDKWYTYSTFGWQDFSANTSFNSLRTQAVLTFTDGSSNDYDLTVNGVITTMSGPVLPSASSDGSDDDREWYDRNEGHCFISLTLK